MKKNKQNLKIARLKRKVYELDLNDLDAIAKKHGITPKLAYDIFRDVRDSIQTLH